MHYAISRPQKVKKNQRIHPLSILILNALFPVLNSFFPSTQGLIFTFGFSMAVLLIFGLYKRIIKSLIFAFIFLLFYHVAIIYDAIIIGTMLKIYLLFIPSIALASILISEYNSSEILSALQKIRLPKIFIIALTVTLRYIPTFYREFKIIKDAMRLRGVQFSFKKPLRTFEYLIVPQLFRCLTLSNELTSAALTKGITAPTKRTSYFEKNFSLWDGAIFLSIIIFYSLFFGGLL